MKVAESIPQLQKGEYFARLTHIDDYLEKGTFPTIHDDFGVAMAQVPEAERTGALDVGACFGMLSVRARKQLGWERVVGAESDKRSVGIFDEFVKPTVDNVHLEHYCINVFDGRFQPWLCDIAKTYGLTTLLMRRVIGDILVDSFPKKIGRDPAHIREAGRLLGVAARKAGFKRILLEGRLWKGYLGTKRHHPLYWTDREVDVLAPLWRMSYKHNDVALLQPYEDVPNPLPTTRDPIVEKDHA